MAPVGIVNAGDPAGAYAEAIDVAGAHQSVRPGGRGRLRGGGGGGAARRARPPRLGRRGLSVAGQGRHPRRRSRRSAKAAARLRRTASRRFPPLREAVAPFDTVGPRLPRAAPGRAAARRRLHVDRGAAGGARHAAGRRRRLPRTRCSARSTTAATATRSPRWRARSPARSAGSPRCRPTGASRSPRPAGSTCGSPAATLAAVAREVFAPRRRPPPRPRAAFARLTGSAGMLRLTWVQPEDLIGHELRQAAEDGREPSSDRRALDGRGRPCRRRRARARRRRAGRAAAARSRRGPARRTRRPAERRRVDEPTELGRRSRPVPATGTADRPRPRRRRPTLGARPAGRRPGSAAPWAACSASPWRRSPARASASSPASTGNWPLARLVHRAGPARGHRRALALEPAQRARPASPRTSTACPRTTTSTTRCSTCCCSQRHGTDFTTDATSPRPGSTNCPPAGSSPPSGSPIATC